MVQNPDALISDRLDPHRVSHASRQPGKLSDHGGGIARMMTQSSWSWMMSGIKHLEGTDVDLEDWSCNMEIKQLTINVIFCEHDHGCVFVKNANLDGCSNVAVWIGLLRTQLPTMLPIKRIGHKFCCRPQLLLSAF